MTAPLLVLEHADKSFGAVRALEVADHHPGVGEEERVVAPARGLERLEHVLPDLGVARPVLVHAVGLDLQLKANAWHRLLSGDGGAPPLGDAPHSPIRS